MYIFTHIYLYESIFCERTCCGIEKERKENIQGRACPYVALLRGILLQKTDIGSSSSSPISPNILREFVFCEGSCCR